VSRCSCVHIHSNDCSIPRDKQCSLYFISPATVYPVAAPSDMCQQLLQHRVRTLCDASSLQQQMIEAGNGASRAVCPFNPNVWKQLLVGYTPSDPNYTADVLIAGMVNGSYVRYEGDRTSTARVRNHPDARAHPEETARLIIQELQLGRMIGPFLPDHSPLPHTKISPLNIVPKKESWRLINDLSSPHLQSVNGGIYHMPTTWQLIQHALQLMTDMGRGCHLAKMDVKSAYRLLPIHPTDWHLFGCVRGSIIY
jgi:hypothetical protein